ncbi:MAG TPA: MraY family glycosyltransferase [Bryobacteraceae bacterium]|nr:MraY family glycosyltransferase [Bryobacteraceae bacterium]
MFLILTLGALSVALALILTPLVRNYLGRWGFLDHPDGIRKKHSTPIPRVGGVAIVLSYVATFAIALALPFGYTRILHHALPNIVPLALVGSLVFLTGVLDDLIGLTAWQKLLGITGASVLAYFLHIHVDIHALHGLPAWPWLGFAITVIWLVGCANAFNLIDGMDGLAAGVGFLATVTMLLAALTQGNLPLALATLPLAGALLGFLRYNFHKASVFLGDSGSLLIGFLLGCFGAEWSNKSVTLVALTVPLLAVSIPLLDVLLSIARRYLRNRPIFQADRGHIHHKLLERGLSPRAAVLTIYALCGMVAVLSLLVSALHDQFSGLIVILFCGVAWIGIRKLEYAEFASAGRMFLGGKFRRIIDIETRLSDFQSSLSKADDVHDCWAKIRTGGREFGFQEVRMCMDGRVFEDLPVAPASRTKPRWQLRIPLPDSQYVNFSRDFDSEMNSMVLSGFVQAVQHGLEARVSARAAMEVLRMPASQELFYAASAAAGSPKSSAAHS